MKESKYNLGLVSVSFREYDPRTIIEAAQAAGLSCIEWGSDVHAPCRDAERLREIAALQAEYGIACSSYGTYFRLGETPAEELGDYIQSAKLLGTDILRLWCGRKSGKDMTDAEKNGFFEVCRRAADIAENNGVTLCMECHRGTFTEDPDDAVHLMETVNSPNFRMYWQPFQWQSAEQNVENAKKIAPFAEHIHVFNWKGDLKLPLADAACEWREYIKAFSAPRTLLLEFMPNGTLEELAGEAAALKNIIGENL